jgi:hypothetical protein
MNIYLSAGASTIAALMAVDRAGRGQQGGPGMQSAAEARPIARRCERAVVTAYSDLRLHGTAVAAALQACSELYRSHHPEASAAQAAGLVAEWVALHCRDGAALARRVPHVVEAGGAAKGG